MQKEITSKEALIRLYSAALYKDGQEVQPEGEITLNIQVGEKYNGKTLKVLHVADGKVETLTGTVTEGVLKVTVSTLGKFGTVVDASTVSTGHRKRIRQRYRFFHSWRRGGNRKCPDR